MVLTDLDLRSLICSDPQCRAPEHIHIYPHDEGQLTALGYDLRVGRSCYVFGEESRRRNLVDGTIVLVPAGRTTLITTIETVAMPLDGSLTGIIQSKVSVVSRGFSHTATTVDPDWRGEFLVAVTNLTDRDLELSVGQGLCTLIFLRNCTPTTTPSGHASGRFDQLVPQIEAAVQDAQAARKRRLAKVRLASVVAGTIVTCALGAVGWWAWRTTAGVAAGLAIGVALTPTVNAFVKYVCGDDAQELGHD